MDKRIATHGEALRTGHDVATCALEGFQRLEKLLKAIARFADLTGAGDLATLAEEAALVAGNYANIADCDAEQFLVGAREIRHGQ
jgi:hypothetical protein